MEWSKVCAIMGRAGEKELKILIQLAKEGWNIAFMDTDKEAATGIKKELNDKYGIKVRMVNEATQNTDYDTDMSSGENDEYDGEYDIEGFFYNGSWEDDEDVDIYRGFLEGKYGGIDYVIESTT